MCECDLCIYKHRKQQESPEIIESDFYHNDVIDISDAKSDTDDAEEEFNSSISELYVNRSAKRTFHNPSQVEKSPSQNIFKCEKCDFAAAIKTDLVNHNEEEHNWC